MDKRKNRVFKSERRDIEYILWRKKVDASIFYEKAILIQKKYEHFWKINKAFKGIHSKTDKKSKVKIDFEGNQYEGFVTELNAKTRTDSYRLFFNSDLANLLKERFLMTFMRDLEFKLGDYGKDPKKRISIEDIIPFNEFIDIEYSGNKKKTFIFTAHFTQPPAFPSLFGKILGTTVLESISLEIENKSAPRILKNHWIKRENLDNTTDQPNVLYMLFDEINKEFYIGEATSLKSRLKQKRPEIPNWSHFRYSILPPELAPFRVIIERMVIRDFASVLKHNKKGVISINISECTLKNKKIDG